MIRLLHETETKLIKDDPVRPHISVEWRTDNEREVYVLESEKVHPYNHHNIDAVICVAYMNSVPINEQELMNLDLSVNPNIAIFYTVWSYRKGSGRKIINDITNIIKEKHPNIDRFVTMSPKTEMAKNFHTNNGAILIAENTDSYNFEYKF